MRKLLLYIVTILVLVCCTSCKPLNNYDSKYENQLIEDYYENKGNRIAVCRIDLKYLYPSNLLTSSQAYNLQKMSNQFLIHYVMVSLYIDEEKDYIEIIPYPYSTYILNSSTIIFPSKILSLELLILKAKTIGLEEVYYYPNNKRLFIGPSWMIGMGSYLNCSFINSKGEFISFEYQLF